MTAAAPWTVTVRDKTLSTAPAAVENPSVTLEMNAKDYVDMANGDLSGIKAVFTRKLKVSGSIPLAKKMNDFLPPNKRSDAREAQPRRHARHWKRDYDLQ